MFNSRYILALDPSGSYKEGQGTTGWVLFDQVTNKIIKFGVIQASKYSCQFRYWDAHINLIDGLMGYKPVIVIEDYLLYGPKATSQINSRLETPQLLGIIKYETYKRGLMVYIQTAAQVKIRWNDNVLMTKGYLHKDGNQYTIAHTPVVEHVRDALRHAIHFATYNSNFRDRR